MKRVRNHGFRHVHRRYVSISCRLPDGFFQVDVELAADFARSSHKPRLHGIAGYYQQSPQPHGNFHDTNSNRSGDLLLLCRSHPPRPAHAFAASRKRWASELLATLDRHNLFPRFRTLQPFLSGDFLPDAAEQFDSPWWPHRFL